MTFSIAAHASEHVIETKRCCKTISKPNHSAILVNIITDQDWQELSFSLYLPLTITLYFFLHLTLFFFRLKSIVYTQQIDDGNGIANVKIVRNSFDN